MLQKLRFCCFICLINKSIYYRHVPVRIGLHLSNSFIQHHRLIYLRWDDWCVWLPSLHCFIILIYLWLFYSCFLVITMLQSLCLLLLKISPYLVVIVFLINFMKSMSNISDILTILMPVTGFFKWAWYDITQKIFAVYK